MKLKELQKQVQFTPMSVVDDISDPYWTAEIVVVHNPEYSRVIAKTRRRQGAVFLAHCYNTHGALVSAMEQLFKHCAMVHKHWGENCNQKQADEAVRAARKALKDAKEVKL